MIEKTNFSFRKFTILSISILGLCFWAGDSMAQSEQEKSEMEMPKPSDKPLTENHSDVADFQTHESINTTTPAASIAPATLPKKDIQTSGEGKKPETAPSTLSFNIFLYIVDKFRAD